MASILNLVKERKHTALISLSLFLLSFFFVVFTRFTNPLSSYQDFESIPSPSTPNPNPNPPPTPIQPEDEDPVKEEFEIKWRICEGGAQAVDYIPCLDNRKAIKELKSRKRMEHRERHCPDTGPRCLVPLPQGYKVRVPWPKSRDMVRLMVR